MTLESIQTQKIRLPSRDGKQLGATLFTPVKGNDRFVIINGATAVKRGYYDHFARYLAEQGFAVLTYDYRGIGDSLEGNIRHQSIRMREWGELDTAGMIDYVVATFPQHRLLLVGHSAGGQLVGLADNNVKVTAVLAVSAQSGNWRLWPSPQKWLLAGLWHGVMPGLVGLCSYFPSKRLGLGENLPAGAAREWARWCSHPDYMVDDSGQPLRKYFDQYPGAIRAYIISDDWMAPRPAVEALMKFYRGARVELRDLTPADIKGKPIGHFGFFRDICQASWKESAEWLRLQ